MNEFSEKCSHVDNYTIRCCFMCGFAQYVFYAILNVNNKKKKAKKILNIKKSTKSKVITVPASTILEIWELPIHIHIFFI